MPGEWLKRWASWRPYWDTMKALEAVERLGDSVAFSEVEARGDAIVGLFADEEPRAMTGYKRRYEAVEDPRGDAAAGADDRHPRTRPCHGRHHARVRAAPSCG